MVGDRDLCQSYFEFLLAEAIQKALALRHRPSQFAQSNFLA